MTKQDTEVWMWSQACALLARTERLHRQFFQLQRTRMVVSWEPPVDVLETDEEVIVLLALPGVDPALVEATIEGAELVVGGVRAFPLALDNAVIHRLELPQGRFERRLVLPHEHYAEVRRDMVHGCLVVRLRKAA